ncbi:RNA polymerase II-associated [Phycomyces nitens]|nr:RNA polymerase II-associated [Phycomyces nitens]
MASKSKFRSDFICRVRYRNTLPPLPFPPKLLDISSLVDRHIPYKTSTLIETTPYSLAIDQNSTRSFDKTLIDYLDAMEANPEDVMRLVEEISEEDKVLMTQPVDEQAAKAKSHFKSNVTWLRRSEYIAAETRTTVVRTEPMEHRFAMSGLAATDRSKEYSTHEGQIAGILKTFEPQPLTLQHPITKKRAKRIIPILPDPICQHTDYSIAQFNVDPADDERLAKRKQADKASGSMAGKKRPSEEDATDRGVLQPITNPHDPDDRYLIWFLPDGEATERLKRQKRQGKPMGDEPASYEFVRDYEYQHDNSSEQKHLIITFRDDGDGEKAYYNLIRGKMTLRKRRALSKKYQQYDDYEKPGALAISFHEV